MRGRAQSVALVQRHTASTSAKRFMNGAATTPPTSRHHKRYRLYLIRTTALRPEAPVSCATPFARTKTLRGGRDISGEVIGETEGFSVTH
jgi:hypothetical protein